MGTKKVGILSSREKGVVGVVVDFDANITLSYLLAEQEKGGLHGEMNQMNIYLHGQHINIILKCDPFGSVKIQLCNNCE